MSDEVIPQLPTVNKVRQVLFNELGMSREYIRELVREEVASTVQHYFKSDQLQQFVIREVNSALRTYHYGADELKNLVAKSVSEAVAKEVRDQMKALLERLHVSVTTEPSEQTGVSQGGEK